MIGSPSTKQTRSTPRFCTVHCALGVAAGAGAFGMYWDIMMPAPTAVQRSAVNRALRMFSLLLELQFTYPINVPYDKIIHVGDL